MRKLDWKNSYMVRIFFILAVPFIFILLASDVGLSQNDDMLNVLRSSPKLSQAPSMASPNTRNQSTDPRVEQIENRLRSTRRPASSQNHQAAAVSGASANRQDSMAEKLRKKLADVAEVRFRSHSGTPRQIRVKAEAVRNGAVLEKAAEGPLTEKARDEKTARNFLRARRGDLRLQDPDAELALSKSATDDLGRRHLRYQQKYKGLSVWPAEVNVHFDASGNVDLMNGAFIPTPRRLVTQPVWTADQAVSRARAFVPEGGYAKAGPPELIIYASGALGARLGWKCLLGVSPGYDWLVVVDAANGNILTAYNQVPRELAAGSGRDVFGDTRSLDTWREGGRYYLADTSKSMYDATSNPPFADTTRGGILVYDMANSEDVNNGMIVSSTSAASGWLPEGVSLAYNLSETYDYFDERHDRQGIDNQKGSVLGFVRYGQDYENAFWTSEYNAVFFGDGVPYAGALDVVAHEITHGVTSFTCNLIYQDQPGAINEAFSDIFGEMVEARTDGGTDWLHGTVLNDKRSLQNPSSIEISKTGYYYPSKMSEFYGRNHPLLQKFVDQDYGGVHINMTIGSHCFYLLAQGMTGAIGIRDAEKIFYRAQTVHLVSNSQFIDLRLACIASAEELFGAGAVQAQKVKDAFDAVEIFDNPSTPEPPPLAPVDGDDSAVFLSYDPYDSGFFLARYEEALGDDSPGVWLSCGPLEISRPSVSGDGSLAFFVDAVEDACFIATDGSVCEECLGFPGTIHSVSMSPDGQVYGMVLLDSSGNRDNTITVFDLRPGGVTRTFNLVAPATEGATVNTVQFADTMDFSADNRYLFYDAYNIIEFRDGTGIGVWSIYAIDLVTEQTFAIAGPFPGYDIGYPAIGQTKSSLITFDMMDQATGETLVVALDLLSGDFAGVGSVSGGNWTVPSYTADDGAIVYSMPDYSTTGYSLVQQPLSPDSLTPLGSTGLYIPDAYSGVMYRRGAFTPPVPEIDIAPKSLAFGSVALGSSQAKTIKVSNVGTSDLMIVETMITGVNKTLYKISGGCTGQTLPSSGECVFTVNFTPISVGVKNATLSIKSNDPDLPTINVALSGTGVSGGATAPVPPTRVSASDGTMSGKVRITWDVSVGAASYDVYRADMPAWAGASPKRIAASVSGTSYDDVSAASGSRYYYWVKAKNSVGVSKYSNFDPGYWGAMGAVPGVPANVSATDGGLSGRVTLSWNLTATTLVYEIWRADIPAFLGGSPKKIGTATATSYNDTTVVSGNQYYYWVKARNSWGVSRYSKFDTGYIGAAASVLPPPTGVSATDGISGKVTITWNVVSGAKLYEIWRATKLVSEGGNPVRVGYLTGISFSDATAARGTTYYYWVKSRDSWGSSKYSVPDTGYRN